MREIIVNLKDTILKYAAAKNHTHNEYVSSEALTNHINTSGSTSQKGHMQLDSNITSNGNNPVTAKTIYSWVNTKLNDYTNTSNLTNLLANYYNKTEVDSLIDSINNRLSKVTTDWSGHSITNPKKTTTKINKLVTSGYYLYDGTNATFVCDPDTISYKNALIKVEKQSNHIIQHVYSTSYSSSSQKYKLDGRIFVRHGYLTTANNGDTEYHWEKWYVSHIPWRERADLLKTKGSNVDNGSFKIYECTAGYVFKWKQTGANNAYTLPMTKYSYTNVYTYKELPIMNGFIVGNLIGHMDVRIVNDAFKVRSTNGKGEVITGVDISYFVPRTN